MFIWPLNFVLHAEDDSYEVIFSIHLWRTSWTLELRRAHENGIYLRSWWTNLITLGVEVTIFTRTIAVFTDNEGGG